jgi:hypothetical protein
MQSLFAESESGSGFFHKVPLPTLQYRFVMTPMSVMAVSGMCVFFHDGLEDWDGHIALDDNESVKVLILLRCHVNMLLDSCAICDGHDTGMFVPPCT